MGLTIEQLMREARSVLREKAGWDLQSINRVLDVESPRERFVRQAAPMLMGGLLANPDHTIDPATEIATTAVECALVLEKTITVSLEKEKNTDDLIVLLALRDDLVEQREQARQRGDHARAGELNKAIVQAVRDVESKRGY